MHAYVSCQCANVVWPDLGVVESLAQPGGNLTGLDVRVFELMGKRLEIWKEAVPTIARVAVLVDLANPIYK